MSRVVIALFLILLLSVHQASWANEQEDLAKRVDAVIAQKAKMKTTYSLRLRIESNTPNAAPPYPASYGYSVNIWRDGDKFRVDTFDSHRTPKRENHVDGSRRVVCENCERPGYVIATEVYPGDPKNRYAVQFKKIGSMNLDPACTFLDWRYFGISEVSLCSFTTMQPAVNLPKFFREKGIVYRFDTKNGLACAIAEIKSPNRDHAVWLSPQHGDNPVYIDVTLRPNGDPHITKVEIDWQQTPGGHFYPKILKRETDIIFAGVKYRDHQVITVSHADFDSPIDPVVFTIPGFGLNENQPIEYPELKSEDQPLWHNGKVDMSYTNRDYYRDIYSKSKTESSATTPAPPSPLPDANVYPTESNSLWIVSIVTGGLSLLLAIAALVIRWRRRTRS